MVLCWNVLVVGVCRLHDLQVQKATVEIEECRDPTKRGPIGE